MDDILGEIRRACEEFLNTMKETLSEKRPVDVPQHSTQQHSTQHTLLFLKYTFTATSSISASLPRPVL
jgi:hypothetical protein